jgi:di/tricarboxylate transporter
MTTDQIMLFGILVVLFGLFVWGRFRYDLVAFTALAGRRRRRGMIEPEAAFEGFGHPAVVIIALVLIVSRGLVNSGAVERIARYRRRAGPRQFRSISASWRWSARRCRRSSTMSRRWRC